MQKQTPAIPPPEFTSQFKSAAEDCLEVARIHRREAKQLLEGAQAAEAEGRREEARLLKDLAEAREATALEFEKTARGETKDPIVGEILDWQEDLCSAYEPHKLTFVTGNEPAPQQLVEELYQPPPGPLGRFVAWVGHWFA
ncbi:MAG: hypothetical protein WB424_17425 [Terracidiphilus sp.]|jgi:hypothetical protein